MIYGISGDCKTFRPIRHLVRSLDQQTPREPKAAIFAGGAHGTAAKSIRCVPLSDTPKKALFAVRELDLDPEILYCISRPKWWNRQTRRTQNPLRAHFPDY